MWKKHIISWHFKGIMTGKMELKNTLQACASCSTLIVWENFLIKPENTILSEL